MDIDRAALMPIFLGESEDNLNELEESVLELESRPGDPEVLGRVFRCAHTLKGNSESVGFEALTACAHALESVLDRVREGAVPMTSRLASLMLQTHDALRSMVKVAAEGGTPSLAEHAGLISQLEAAIKNPDAIEPALPVMRVTHYASSSKHDLRVDLATLDRIMTSTGELSIARARLRDTIEKGASRAEMLDALEETERLFSDLREQVTRLRLVPIGPMFRQQQRALRDMAVSHGKLVNLETEGTDVLVDTAIVESLRDPIMHMIRNALDHAIEDPAVREKNGKPPAGTITLSARHEGGRVLVDVKDDGAGFDRERILARAREVGLESSPEMSDSEVYKLVFVAGFSTAPSVTDLSGRGVGMDVVARNVAAVKGSVSISSTPGRGAQVTIRVPLTLTIIQGFAVGVANEAYVVPLELVRECVDLPASRREESGPFGLLNLRGEPLPYLRLRDVFAIPGERPAIERVVVVEQDGMRAGLAVDDLHGERQTVVKPLDSLFADVEGIAGSTIMGNGHVALILDVASMMRTAIGRLS